MAEAFVDYLADFGNGNHTYEFRLTTPRSDVAISPIDGTTVTDFRQQTIELVTELAENEVRRVNVQLVEKRDNGTEHYFSYIVEFRSPFDINVAEPIALETPIALPTTDDFANRVDVNLIVGNILLWTEKDPTDAFWNYFDNRDDFLFSFAIAEGEDQNGRLSIDPTTGMITWSNDGSTLLEDTPAHVVITLQVPGIVTFETVIPITLKKTTVGGE